MDDRQFYARAFLIALLGVITLVAYQLISPLLGPLVWAAIIAFALYPLQNFLCTHIPKRKNLVAFIVLSVGIIFIIAPLLAVGSAFVAQAAKLLGDIQQGAFFTKPLEDITFIGTLIEWLETNLNISADDLNRWVNDSFRSALQFFIGLGGKIFIGAVNTVVAFTVMVFVLFFFIRDNAEIINGLKALTPLSKERIDEFYTYAAEAMNAVLFGTVATALVQGALVGIAFAVIGLPAPVVFGAVTALFALLPVGGPSIIWIPAALYLASVDRWGAAIGLTIWGLAMVATIDNILRPILVSSRVHVSTLAVFIGVIGGVSAFGMIGLLIGPVLMALIMTILRYISEAKRNEAD
jgi:predicted PurR-regulated permease PerM